MPDFAFSSTAKDYPWWIRRLARRIIANIKAFYREKALICVMRYGAAHGILYAQAQVLTADVLDNHFGAVASWRQRREGLCQTQQ